MSNHNPNDETPMLVRHGRVVWKDVVETKAAATSILELLETEDSPVLDSLARIEAMLTTLLTILLPPANGTDAR